MTATGDSIVTATLLSPVAVTCCFNPTFHKLTMFITAAQSTILLSQHETICFKPLKLKFHAGETKVS
ncbi:hypothetical protein, partial [Bacteroides acidifaciens]|uniref:hypothetical protein n=2 Tax=Bacteroides acidifaciens TaxID=85831 RepID=UPI0025906957